MKIHPAIGVARVGDSEHSFYIGPERAGGLPTEPEGGAPVEHFKDAAGALRRQAARFRIYAGDAEIVVGGELEGQRVVDIVWTVHLANKKSSF